MFLLYSTNFLLQFLNMQGRFFPEIFLSVVFHKIIWKFIYFNKTNARKSRIKFYTDPL